MNLNLEDGINPVKILYQDDDFIAVFKPAGLLVHRTSLDREESIFLIQVLRDQIEKEVHPCHRLDKATSGVMLLALNKDALRLANKTFATNSVEKTYLAITRGWIEHGGELDYPLKLEDLEHKKILQSLTLQSAITHYAPLEKYELPIPLGRYSTARFTLCQLTPKTGRRHQLRRHLAHLRYPIIGDTTHGDGLQNKFARSHFNCKRLLLTATEIKLKHPTQEGWLQVSTNPDRSFSDVIDALRMDKSQTESGLQN